MTPEQAREVKAYRKCSLNDKMVMAIPSFVFMLDLCDEQAKQLEATKGRIALLENEKALLLDAVSESKAECRSLRSKLYGSSNNHNNEG